MIQKIPNSIIITRSAYLQIQQCVEKAANLYEIGGILVGHKNESKHYIEAITVDISNCETSKTSFVLNGELHTHMAQKIIDSSKKPLAWLGVWHSHICDTARFSQQDRDANNTLANILNGALSVLVTWDERAKEVTTHGYYIAPDNSEHYQNIVIQ